jgi:glucose/arabinose dehydrogenase/chitodextrinase
MFNRETFSLRYAFIAVLACLAVFVMPSAASAVVVPAGFQQSTVWSGLEYPMDVEVAPNGRVFVAEKSGIVKTYTSLSDQTPTIAADLRTQTHNFSARGLTSIVADPNYPTQPYIYVYYTLDAKIGGTPPLYGDVDGTWDNCDKANLGLAENCVVGGRISRIRLGNQAGFRSEQVLVEDWCQQYPVHSGGGLSFGADGYLYFTGGDGSTASFWDYGQTGTPPNPCGDPPGGIGDLLTTPTSEGGRLRVQDLRTAGDPTGLDGSLIRIDPRTGAGAPGNPLANSGDANERRILAYGFRDPLRLAIRPGTNDVWVGDRGGGYFEEFDRVPDLSRVRNFGWPCYEGAMDANGDPYTRIRPRSVEEGAQICLDLYALGNATDAPHWSYDHELNIVPDEPCAKNTEGGPLGALLSSMHFYPAAGGNFPAPYRKALFFGDRIRDCIFALLPGSDGLPERGNVMLFASEAFHPTDLEVTSTGDLLYVDQELDSIHRIRYTGNPANKAPTAVAAADKVSGPAPLTVRLDGTKSTDPDLRDAFSYAWDLDGDGQYDDSTNAKPKLTLRRPGTATVSVRVTDTGGLSSTNSLGIEISEPATTLTFTSTEDSRVEKNHLNTNFGTQDRLRTAGGTAPNMETYLRFQVSGIPAEGEVRSAKLRMTASSTGGTVDGPAAHGMTGEWTEAGITWANKPATDAEPASDAGAIAVNEKVEYDVTSLVKGNGPTDIALVSTSTDAAEFLSREASKPEKFPVLEVTFGHPYDDKAPTAPADLVAEVSGANVTLGWTEATDNIGVTNHEIYRNGDLLAVTGNVTSYTDTTGLSGATYEYVVKALDKNDNRSDASNTATATMPDTARPTEPENLTATASGDQVALTWDESSDNVAVTGYRIYKDGTEIGTTDGATSTTHTVTGLEAGPHTFTVRAIDAAGNLSSPSAPATANVPDTVKPTAPANLTGETAPGLVILNWEAATDNLGVTGYRIYRNGTQVGSVLGAITTFTHTSLQSGDSDYTVRAVDAAGNLSDPSNSVTVNIPDAQPPTAPWWLRAEEGAGQVELRWFGSSDNVAVAGYRIYRNGNAVADVGSAARSYIDTNVVGSLSYTVRAFDGAGNLSNASNTASATVADTVKPTTPSELNATASPGQVALSWAGSTDNVGVTGYRIYRNGTQVGSVLGNVTTFTHTGLTAGTYSYTVRAVDAAGNLSDASTAATAIVPDSVKPTAPTNLTATLGSGNVVLRWNASTDNIGVTGYRVYQGGTQIAQVAGNVLTYTHTGVAGPLSYVVRAIDAAGNLSDPSNTRNVTAPDGIKPTVPGNLTATAGTSQVVLNWEASTDNAAVTGYRIYRAGTQVGSVNGTTLTFTHTNVAPGTHSYTVRAIDAAGNLSDPSNTQTVTLADTQAPTVPGTLAGSAASPTRVNLTWGASTDNVGVTNYEVYRNGLLLAGPGNVTSYADTTTVASTTYQYTVRAVDAVGNRSGESNTLTVTTPATAPATPGTKTFSPVADARVQEANPTTNYGTATTLRTSAGSNPDVESYLKFDVSDIPAPVKTAVLRVTPQALSWNGPGVRSAAGGWTETGITWNNRPARGATLLGNKGILWQTVDYDVKSLVTGNGTVSFALTADSSYATDFGSREHGTASERPQLIVTY